MPAPLDRRNFLKRAGALGGAAMMWGPLAGLSGAARGSAAPQGSLLDLAAADSPIDTIVVLLMENRSFDHYLGWLARDGEYLEESRRRYGAKFRVDGDQTQVFRDPKGRRVPTYHLPSKAGEDNPYRGCHHPDPGHGWESGRAQRDHGFMAEDAGNDEFALGYFRAEDIPTYSAMVRRFTTFDRYFASLLAPTYPNRAYLHAAQSGGMKTNELPYIDGAGFYEFETIWDRMQAASVPCRYYFVDLPTVGLWGPRMLPIASHIERYFVEAAAGRLPNVVFLDPGFTTGLRTDDHPYADIRAGQRLVYDYVKAFVESPHWERGAFLISYDEWGGFFDHVRPPRLPDLRRSKNDKEDFGQAGFRVPTIMASPYARPGFVDHRVYDHTSILRFIEWRFLGAPAEGPKGSGWFLTPRDRFAHNIGASLLPAKPNPEFHLEPVPKVPFASAPCEGETFEGTGLPVPVEAEKHAFEQSLDAGFFERAGFDIDIKPYPL